MTEYYFSPHTCMVLQLEMQKRRVRSCVLITLGVCGDTVSEKRNK